MIVRKPKFRLRAEHPARQLAADLDTLDVLSAWQNRPFRRKRHFIARFHVGRAAHHWQSLSSSSDLADDQVIGLRMGINADNLSDLYRFSPLLADPFNLKSGHGEPLGQTVGR
jgi:hypothetical protein